ncbi:MAG: hypothetical protein PUP92_14130 [Rhizonema sp. PD38]|nr:hypothetical protein [Rhizonema sp. PD38]
MTEAQVFSFGLENLYKQVVLGSNPKTPSGSRLKSPSTRIDIN